MKSVRCIRSRNLSSVCDLLVVFIDTHALSHLLVLEANRQKLPTLCLQEGASYTYGNTGDRLRVLKKLKSKLVKVPLVLYKEYYRMHKINGELCRYNLVYGKSRERELLERGSDPAAVYQVGYPGLSGENENEESVCDKPRKLLFAHQQTFDELEIASAMYQVMAQLASEYDIPFEFKKHPRSSLTRDRLASILAGYPYTLVEDGDIQDYDLTSTLLITGDSTSAYRGLIDEAYIILVKEVVKGRGLPLEDSGSAIGVRDAHELHDAIQSIMQSRQVREKLVKSMPVAIRDHLGSTQQTFGVNVAEAIKSITKG